MVILTSNSMPNEVCALFDQIVFLPENPDLDHRVSFHADLSVFSFADTVVCAPYLFDLLFEKLDNMNVLCGQRPFSPYPNEVMYNAALVGKYLFCNEKYTSRTILTEAEKRNIKIVDVAQGYSKCSTVIVNSNSIITSDESIRKAAEKNGIETLLVSNNGVILEGYSNGFIGGASIVTEKEVFFTGDLRNSPDYEKIIDFIENKGKRPVFFYGLPLLDMGSPIVINKL